MAAAGTFASIVGQEHAIEGLRRAARADRLAGAYLFAGPAGVGKATAARALARALDCDEGDPESCAPCHACDRIEREMHPDVPWLRPDGASIKIEQVRDLQLRLAHRPNEARRRVVIVDPADKLYPNAQNALLKLLEEPRLDTHIVLISAAPHRLLPTVRSRCQRVTFVPLGAKAIAKLCEARGADTARAGEAARLCDGSVGRAIALLEGDALDRRMKAADAIAQAAASRSAASVFATATRLGSERPEIEATLEILRARCRDAASAADAPGRRVHVRRAWVVTEALADLAANVAVPLVVERLAFRWGAHDLLGAERARATAP
ncbi:MAG: DNA polymerase III subunit delta' [Myxococcota bacterium]